MGRRLFIFVNEPENLSAIFYDLEQDERVRVLHGPCKELNSSVLQFLRHHHLRRFRRKLPFKSIWSYSLKTIDWDKDTDYFVIFTSASLYPIKAEYLLWLQKNYHVKYVLHMGDHWSSPFSAIAREYSKKVYFDYVFSVDDSDVQRYGFIKSNAHYSLLVDRIPVDINYDLYFVGQDKGRLKTLHQIYDKTVRREGATALYRIQGIKARDQTYDGIIYNQRISYRDSLEEMKHSNCILEVLIEGMTGATLRYNEAVCYNKKLLTNNKNIVNLPFYDPRYMRVFDSPDDIDVEWVRERVPINYHYDGRFSPTHIIDKIIELEEQKTVR